MLKFKKISIIIAIFWLSQLIFLSFWKSVLVINNVWTYKEKIIPLKWWCQKVINNCDLPIWVPLFSSAETKSFFLNYPSCIVLSTCDRVATCQWTLPANTEWNTSNTYTQVFDWLKRIPISKTANYNEVPSSDDCRYKCELNYTRNGVDCNPDTRAFTCSDKPSVWTIWNTISSYTQTWDWDSWTPVDTTTIYNDTSSTTSCRYTCDSWYRRDSTTSSCINTCSVPSSLGWWTIIDGQSVTWYADSSVICWNTCVEEARVCDWETWLLWWTYTNWSCSIENCAPTANNVTAIWNEWSTVNVVANANDSDGSVYSYAWYSNSSCTSVIWSSINTYTAPAQPEPTTITYYYKVQDDDWDRSNCASATVIWNNVCPNAPVLVSPPDWIWTSNRQFCATVSDPGWWNVSAFFVIWWITYPGNTVDSNNNSCYTHTADLDWISWYAYARDMSGANSCTLSPNNRAYIDTISPTTTDNANSNRRNTDMVVTLSPNESSVTTRYCIDTNWTCTPNTIWTIANVTCSASTVCPSQYVRYYSTDSAGNTEPTKTSVQIKIDKQAPTFVFANVSWPECIAGVLSISSASDVWVWLHTSPYSFDWINWLTTTSTSVSTWQPWSVNIAWRVRDLLWNSSSITATYTFTNVIPTANNFVGHNSVWNTARTANWKTLSSATEWSCGNSSITYNSVITQWTRWVCSVLWDIITYTPNANQIGTDFCTIQLKDNENSTVNIIVSWMGIDTVAPICAFSDSVAAGPVATDTVATNISDATTIKWKYNVDTNCPTTASSYPNTTTSWTINTQSYNWQYVCIYWSDSAWNYCRLSSANDVNIWCPTGYTWSAGTCVLDWCTTDSDCDAGEVCNWYVAAVPATAAYCGWYYYFPDYYNNWSCWRSDLIDMTYWAYPSVLTNAYAVSTANCYITMLSMGWAWYWRNSPYPTKWPCTATTSSTCSTVGYTLTKYNSSITCPWTFSTNNYTCKRSATTYQCSTITDPTICDNTPTVPSGWCTWNLWTSWTPAIPWTCIAEPAVCGNGIKEWTEQCDWGSTSCTYWWVVWTKNCTSSCTWSTTCSVVACNPSYNPDLCGWCKWSFVQSNCVNRECSTYWLDDAIWTCTYWSVSQQCYSILGDACSESTCFTAGTKVRTADWTNKNIEDIEIWEKLLGQDNQINKVMAFDRPNLGERKLYSINNWPYFVTHEHPFMTLQWWKSISPDATRKEMPNFDILPLKVGDVLVKENNEYEYIWNIQSNISDPKTPLYNFKLDWNNTYYADWYLVHNKEACDLYNECPVWYICEGSYCIPDDWWCFVKWTQIKLPGGQTTSIENIKIWDIVIWSDDSKNKVVRLFKIYNKSWDIYSINNSDYFVTDTHPFMTVQWWKSFDPQGTLRENPDIIVSKLGIWDILITDKWTVKIYNIKQTQKSGYVYNFKLDWNHTYYADWYLVHNPVIK